MKIESRKIAETSLVLPPTYQVHGRLHDIPSSHKKFRVKIIFRATSMFLDSLLEDCNLFLRENTLYPQ